ncbi:MAG: M42 family metallopeptidase [Tepidisphaeraceae bacterium]
MNIDLLKQLSEMPGVPGREERVRDFLTPYFKKAFDKVSVDAMGNLIGRKKPKKAGPRVIFAAHIDEIGFYVKHIDDKGYLRLNNVGGFDTRNLLARRVRVQCSNGDELIGLMNPGGRPVHIARDEDRKKIPEVGEFFVDLCLPASVVKERVRIGDPVTLIQDFAELGDCVTGKCLDNRVATFVMIEAMRKVKNLKYDLTVAATVQEEVGLRGAGPAAFGADPEIGIALDTTLCCDTPGIPEDERVTQQGKGVAIKVMDGSAIGDRRLVDDFVKVAEARQIPYQLAILPRGGTDAGAMQRTRAGIRTLTLGVPTRYIHTVTECVHKADLQSAIDLIAAWLGE